MITLTFNFWWIPVIIIVLFGIIVFIRACADKNDKFGFGAFYGFIVLIGCILLAVAIGGFTIW